MSNFFAFVNWIAGGMLLGALIGLVHTLFERKFKMSTRQKDDHRVHITLEDESGRKIEREAESVSAVPGVAEEAARELARSGV